MKILAFMLIALVASMVVGLPASFADSKLDSLVNIATKARSQVNFELDRSQNASDEIRALFEQGSQQTDLLISAVEQNKVADAKKHFVAAMKIFKEVTVKLSEPQQVTPQEDLPPASTAEVNYKNDIDRTEKYVDMLKDLAEKNNFTVDFSQVDELIQDARSNLEKNDIAALEETYVQLRSALNDIQNIIQQQTEQRQDDRARSFANGYIAKIDSMLEQADEMGLSDEEITRLVKAKEELASISDPNLLIIKIRQYSITISQTTYDAKQRILDEVSQLEKKLEDLEAYRDDSITSKFEEARKILAQLKGETSADATTELLRQLDSTIKEIEDYVRTEQAKREAEQSEQDKPEPQRQEQKQDITQQREESKRASSEVLKLEARLAEIKPYVDENIESKFESAQVLLNRLLNQEAASVADYNRTIRILDFLIDSMEEYVESLEKAENKDKSEKNKVKQEKSGENKNRGSDKKN